MERADPEMERSVSTASDEDTGEEESSCNRTKDLWLSDCFPFSPTQSLEVRGEAPLTLSSNRVDRVGRAEGTRTNDIEFRWQENT